MSDRDFVDLLVIPQGSGRVRQVRLPAWALRAAVFGVAFLLLGAVLSASLLYALFRARSANDALETENHLLRSELVALGARIDSLDSTVRDHIRLANEARLLSGLPPYEEEVALLGVGGSPAPEDFAPKPGVPAALGRTVATFSQRLDQIELRLRFQEESLEEARKIIEASREELDHIPTINPVLGPHYISSGFGRRRDPFTGQPAFHKGMDFCAPLGTPFRATADGIVTFAGKNGRFGSTIKIDHGNGYETVYAHAKRLLVRKGQRVRRGDMIGEVGNSGRSTGSHLHYEVHRNGKAVNPKRYLLEEPYLAD